ncbi:hypothetical protein [Arsenicicoccus dermatophilus]|uniref:hypothetical protein n=1 Tax=Arsenicicoccus dermatophilus TaxID=1076331 RepID=UPI001F4C6521|nr:hypothetical protein [Arsenicicoccus dermatophilus]MCH8614005.1 hypothetical protein [Arsenicicoccus dermatophilus]
MTRRFTVALPVAAVVAAGGIGLVGHAIATPSTSTTAGTSDRSQIYAAVAANPALRGWKATDWRLEHVEVTAAGWARATVHATHGQTDDATAVLHRARGRWTVSDLGTAQVGCGVVPTPVLESLRLGDC